MTALRVQSQDAAPVVFDPAFLQPREAATLDMTRFARGNPVLAGHYDVDVWMNGDWQARKGVRFEGREDGADALPCIPAADLVAYGVDPATPLPAADEPCLPLGQRIPPASTRFDVSEQRLDIEVPQAAMARRRSGAVAPAQWDHGVTAGLLAWRIGVRHSAGRQRRDTATHAGIDAGFNAGAWRMRHAGAFSGRRYRERHTYLERPVASWRARLRLGHVPWADDTFPPVPLRGIALASDARMAPDGLGGYAPRVKGVAATHATVRITQNGILLRELVVPPGPFEVDDLYAAGRGGDIEVDIEEHGRHRTFRVPFFPVPELLREGRTAYAFAVGRSMASRGASSSIAQANWRHGFPGDVTAYAGVRAGGGSLSLLAGGAVSTLAGALAMDATRTRLPRAGSAMLWRLRHGRQWGAATLVSLALARGREGIPRTAHAAPREGGAMHRVDLLVQHDLGGKGALGVNTSHVRYARGNGGSVEQAMSWTRTWDSISVDITLRRSRRYGHLGRYSEGSGQLSLSMPLGVPPSSATLHATLQGGTGAGGLRVGVNGQTGDAGATQYGLAVGRDRGQGGRFDASLARRLPAADVVATLDRAPGSRSASLAASGGLVFHRGGVTPAPRLGDALALVQAPGARGAAVAGPAGVRIGRRGYAVVPYLTPYRWNAIDLDPTGTSLDVGFVSTHRRVAPTAGAVVLVPFETALARTVLVTGRLADGRPLPFGAEVFDGQARSAGVVGQAGRIFLRADRTDAHWTVRWAGAADGQCALRLQPAPASTARTPRLTGVCE